MNIEIGPECGVGNWAQSVVVCVGKLPITASNLDLDPEYASGVWDKYWDWGIMGSGVKQREGVYPDRQWWR
jgi:hypothetical protein